ncbi:protein of unknown function DUF1526 (plasmid) [Rhizorhabdus wittichii RW1]|uniref:Abi-like protein n=1 Tax=Rhizorhabdus wittichii (strain DSM 6014 / CCUG 31198 / JCM 15750 / NBRC 105917 / EY 4224 / RW1) TaxID=392499 RepID=A0A9J9LF78_RHIWR|nr:protein of unknown function DUF1526 [Rhizorhabdus wittichii RW1]
MPTFVHALSADRFDTYLKWAGADQTLAERLYTYNVQLSAALYGPLHMLEVVLRNMADAQLAAQHGAAWIDDPAILVTNYQTGAIAKARQTLQKDGKAATRPQIVAELNFGFWASLFGPKSHHLWQSLRPIFQAKGVQRGVIARDLRDLRILRNRVAHYEPIIALPLAQRYASITTLTGWLSPSAATWIAKYSTWPTLYPAVPILVPDPASGDLLVAPAALPFLPA